MRIRDSRQRREYAIKRTSLAVDRQITARTPHAKEQARRWVMRWARRGGLA